MFQVGDKVRVVKDLVCPEEPMYIGACGEVVCVLKNDDYDYVIYSRGLTKFDHALPMDDYLECLEGELELA